MKTNSAFNISPATPDIVRKFIGHGLTMPVPSKSTVEQIASRIRHREYRARKQNRARLTAVRLCGHCGAKPRVVGRRSDGYYVTCVGSNCPQPTTTCHKTRQGAIDEWNEETA